MLSKVSKTSKVDCLIFITLEDKQEIDYRSQPEVQHYEGIEKYSCQHKRQNLRINSNLEDAKRLTSFNFLHEQS